MVRLELIFISSTVLTLLFVSFIISIYVDDRSYSRSIGLNGYYRQYINSVIVFHVALFFVYFVFLITLLLGGMFDSAVTAYLFIVSQVSMSVGSLVVLISRYKIAMSGVNMDDSVVVRPKSLFKSKTFWVSIVTGVMFVSEYVSINMDLLTLSDKDSMLLMFVTGLISGVCLLSMRMLTDAPIKGSPAHARAIRSRGGS